MHFKLFSTTLPYFLRVREVGFAKEEEEGKKKKKKKLCRAAIVEALKLSKASSSHLCSCSSFYWRLPFVIETFIEA